jgi:hypothetical protein
MMNDGAEHKAAQGKLKAWGKRGKGLGADAVYRVRALRMRLGGRTAGQRTRIQADLS